MLLREDRTLAKRNAHGEWAGKEKLRTD